MCCSRNDNAQSMSPRDWSCPGHAVPRRAASRCGPADELSHHTGAQLSHELPSAFHSAPAAQHGATACVSTNAASCVEYCVTVPCIRCTSDKPATMFEQSNALHDIDDLYSYPSPFGSHPDRPPQHSPPSEVSLTSVPTCLCELSISAPSALVNWQPQPRAFPLHCCSGLCKSTLHCECQRCPAAWP